MNDDYLKSKKILLVDDEKSLRDMLLCILNNEQYYNLNP